MKPVRKPNKVLIVQPVAASRYATCFHRAPQFHRSRQANDPFESVDFILHISNRMNLASKLFTEHKSKRKLYRSVMPYSTTDFEQFRLDHRQPHIGKVPSTDILE